MRCVMGGRSRCLPGLRIEHSRLASGPVLHRRARKRDTWRAQLIRRRWRHFVVGFITNRTSTSCARVSLDRLLHTRELRRRAVEISEPRRVFACAISCPQNSARLAREQANNLKKYPSQNLLKATSGGPEIGESRSSWPPDRLLFFRETLLMRRVTGASFSSLS